jgi:hypothetical protein
MAPLTPEQQRANRRRRKHERQAVVFGSLLAALALAGLGATAIYTGAMDASFLAREFTSPPPEDVVAIPLPPCIPDETLPPAPETISVRVYNATGRVGLAGQAAAELTARGFVVLETANYPVEITTGAWISFGESGIASAYALAAHIESGVPALVLDTRTDASVDLILGEGWDNLLDVTAVALDPTAPMFPLDGCLPLEEARVLAVPGPTASPEATPGSENEGGDAPAEGDAATEG